MRADHNGCIPVESLSRFVSFRLWLDENHFAGLAVKPHQIALLPFRIDDIRIGRIDRLSMSITKQGYKPVTVANAVIAIRPGRAALTVVVLGSAIDIVERCVIVHGYFVELGDRKVG